MEVGRRGIWGREIKQLFGSDVFDHIIYYDTVGCGHTGALQRIVVTNTVLYMYDQGTKVPPPPFCRLSQIIELTADHETPGSYRGHPDFDAHHIFFKVRDQIPKGETEYHLYTFEPGTDLFWRLKTAVEATARVGDPKRLRNPLEPNQIRVIEGVPEHTYYIKLFNNISSRIVQAKSHRDRMKAFKELNELSEKYFPTRAIFFQSATLMTFLMDTLTFLSDCNSVPGHIADRSRLDELELLLVTLKTISYYLDGSTTTHDVLKIISYNHGCYYKTLIKGIFRIEWFILSHPERAKYYLRQTRDKSKYMEHLHDIEDVIVTIFPCLFSLSMLARRTIRSVVDRDMFMSTLKENEEEMKGCFHTIVFVFIQMCLVMPDLQKQHEEKIQREKKEKEEKGRKRATVVDPGATVEKEEAANPPNAFGVTYMHSIYDHLWFINYIQQNFPVCADMMRSSFISEFSVIVTEARLVHFLPRDESIKQLYDNILSLTKAVRNNVLKRRLVMTDQARQPVLFRC